MIQSPRRLGFEVAFTSGPEAVRGALAKVLTELEPLALAPDTRGTIEIVLAEALNNIVEHAYPETDPAGQVSIVCTEDGPDLHFRLVDHGRPMPDEQLPPGLPADVGVDLGDLPEGGFGWHLIRNLTSDISYRRKGDTNVLDLRLPVLHTA